MEIFDETTGGSLSKTKRKLQGRYRTFFEQKNKGRKGQKERFT